MPTRPKTAAERRAYAKRAAASVVDRYVKPDGSLPELDDERASEPEFTLLAPVVDTPIRYVPAMPKRRPGAPSKYEPRFCQTVIDDALLGHSLTGTAALLGIDRSTLNEWASEFPEFSKAIARAKAVRARGYEGELIDMRRNGGDAARFAAVKLGLTNTANDEWRERFEAKVDVNLTLADLITSAIKTIDGEVVTPPALDKPRE